MISVLAHKVKVNPCKIPARRRMKIKINQHPGMPGARNIDAAGAVILLLPESALHKDWPEFPHGDVLCRRVARRTDREANSVLLVTDLPNRDSTPIAVACIKSESSAFELLSLARELVTAVLKHKPESVLVCIGIQDDRLALRVAETQVAALLAAAAEMPRYKSKPERGKRLQSIEVRGTQRQDFSRTQAEAHGNALARFLTHLPPNELTPAHYRRHIAKLAKQHDWRLRFIDQRALQRLGAGAFLAVAQGSPEPDAGIAAPALHTATPQR